MSTKHGIDPLSITAAGNIARVGFPTVSPRGILGVIWLRPPSDRLRHWSASRFFRDDGPSLRDVRVSSGLAVFARGRSFPLDGESGLVDVQPWLVIVLAVVQGISEFLPISSSGHVVILAALLSGNHTDLEIADLNVVLHVGTLFSILVYYWRRIWRLLGEDRRTIGLVGLATIPAVVVGFGVKLFARSEVLENPLLAGCLLPVTGVILIWGARYRESRGEYNDLRYRRALWIGLSQACAILPGLSRSGLTISMGLRAGLSPSAAATFSFLLAIPVLAGAGLLEAISMVRKGDMSTPLPLLLAGMLISFVVGLAALWMLDHMLRRGRIQWFAAWVIPVGILYVAAHLLGWLPGA